MNKNKIITHLQLHLLELKYTLITFLISFFYIFLISYYFSDQLIYLLVNNLLGKEILEYFIFTNITEIFTTNFFVSMFVSIFISTQLVIILSWFFLKDGLYRFENFIFIKFYFFFIIFTLFIIKIILINIIPFMWNYLLHINFSSSYILTVYFEPKIYDCFNFIFSSFMYLFSFFIYFFFIIYLILNRIFLKVEIIINLRKFFYLKIILLTSLITPPDVIYFFFIYFLFILIFEIFMYILIYFNKYDNNSY